jgi:hypothetical protein
VEGQKKTSGRLIKNSWREVINSGGAFQSELCLIMPDYALAGN